MKYLLKDDELKRLEKIMELYKTQRLELSAEKMFEGIMCCGSKYEIDNKLKFHEWKLGLRGDFL